jgi:hypothetical protein
MPRSGGNREMGRMARHFRTRLTVSQAPRWAMTSQISWKLKGTTERPQNVNDLRREAAADRRFD